MNRSSNPFRQAFQENQEEVKKKKNTLGSYSLNTTPIGEGYYGSVYKGYKNGIIYAVKVLKIKLPLGFTEELMAYQQLDHLNIIKLHDYQEDAEFKPYDSPPYKCNFLVFEYIKGCELFDIVIRQQQIPDSGLISIFNQILTGLQFMYEKGFAHGNLKMENILLDENFTIKIADIGTALRSGKISQSNTQIDKLGYVAPEFAAGKPSNAFASDIFSLGCIFFMTLTRIPVTEGHCTEKDPVYQHFCNGQPDLFWTDRFKMADQYKTVFTVSYELRDLINGMLCYDPEKRLTLQEVINHSFFNGRAASQSQLCRLFQKELETFCPGPFKFSQEEGPRRPSLYMRSSTGKTSMGRTSVIDDQEQLEMINSFEDYDYTNNKLNVLYSEAFPDTLMQKLQIYLEEQDITPFMDDEICTIQYLYLIEEGNPFDEKNQQDVSLNVQIDFQKLNDETTALVFSTKDSGYGKWLLNKHVEQFLADNDQTVYRMKESDESQAQRAEVRAEIEALTSI